MDHVNRGSSVQTQAFTPRLHSIIHPLRLSLLALATLTAACSAQVADSHQVSPKYERFVEKAKDNPNVPKPHEMLLNTDPEPDLTRGFVSLYNGRNLDGWVQRGNMDNRYEADGENIVGIYVPPSTNSYLCTERDDFKDFIFTVEMKWLLHGNSGIQFRSKVVGKSGVRGPQVELEEVSRGRKWSGGVYAQGIGGFFYPLWLEAHAEAREAINYDGWNRITIYAVGDTVKTWINGVPCAHFKNSEYTEGYFGLQVHKAEEGLIHFRNIKVKEL